MTRNHPELVQILEIFIYSENTGILPIERTTIRMVNYNQQQYTFVRLADEEQAGPDKDLFLPVDILQK
jgi:hypothetical protein